MYDHRLCLCVEITKPEATSEMGSQPGDCRWPLQKCLYGFTLSLYQIGGLSDVTLS